MEKVSFQDISMDQLSPFTLNQDPKRRLPPTQVSHTLLLGESISLPPETMERLTFMIQLMVHASKSLISQKMRKLRNSLVPTSTLLEKLAFSVTSTDSTFSTTTPRDHSGMRSVANKSKTITL
jgi:hypothetical protein